jgi:hypothetical protein
MCATQNQLTNVIAIQTTVAEEFSKDMGTTKRLAYEESNPSHLPEQVSRMLNELSQSSSIPEIKRIRDVSRPSPSMLDK